MEEIKTPQDLEGLRVDQLIELIPETVAKAHGLRANTKKEIVLDVVIEHLNLKEEVDTNAPDVMDIGHDDKLANFASETAKEVKESKVKDKVYVAHNNNFYLKPKGLTKDGRLMRYAVGFDSLSIKEQNENNPDGVDIDFIRFEGSGNREAEFMLDGFGVVRSQIKVPAHNQLLQQYIETHRHYGLFFTEFDESKRNRDEVIDRMNKGKVEGMIANATRNELIAPLAFLDSKYGVNTFDTLSGLNEFDLKKRAYDSIDFDFKEFMDASRSGYGRVLHLVNLSKSKNIISLENNNRDVCWTRNNENIVTVPPGVLWNEAVVDFMILPLNVNMITKLEEIVGYKTVV